MIALINRLLGTDILPSYRDPRPGDVRHSQADIARARAELGYEPRTDFERGLRRCLDWMRGFGAEGGSRKRRGSAVVA